MLDVKIENLGFNYGDEPTEILSDLSLDIESGAYIAFVGANGSGKSTLSRLINGLLAPKRGKIIVLGMDTGDKSKLFEIRKSCGIVFQNPDNQMVASIVEDDVAFGPENVGVEPERIAERIDFALRSTGTEQFRSVLASTLSGGQKQRVAIAGVLALKPKILILDESTSMLDPIGRHEVMEVVKKLNKQENMTVIVITHYMDEVTDCDKIAVLSAGKIIGYGTPKQVFSDQDLIKRAGLSQPLPQQITALLKERGVDAGFNLTVEELKESLCRLLQKT